MLSGWRQAADTAHSLGQLSGSVAATQQRFEQLEALLSSTRSQADGQHSRWALLAQPTISSRLSHEVKHLFYPVLHGLETDPHRARLRTHAGSRSSVILRTAVLHCLQWPSWRVNARCMQWSCTVEVQLSCTIVAHRQQELHGIIDGLRQELSASQATLAQLQQQHAAQHAQWQGIVGDLQVPTADLY